MQDARGRAVHGVGEGLQGLAPVSGERQVLPQAWPVPEDRSEDEKSFAVMVSLAGVAARPEHRIGYFPGSYPQPTRLVMSRKPSSFRWLPLCALLLVTSACGSTKAPVTGASAPMPQIPGATLVVRLLTKNVLSERIAAMAGMDALPMEVVFADTPNGLVALFRVTVGYEQALTPAGKLGNHALYDMPNGAEGFKATMLRPSILASGAPAALAVLHNAVSSGKAIKLPIVAKAGEFAAGRMGDQTFALAESGGRFIVRHSDPAALKDMQDFLGGALGSLEMAFPVKPAAFDVLAKLADSPVTTTNGMGTVSAVLPTGTSLSQLIDEFAVTFQAQQLRIQTLGILNYWSAMVQEYGKRPASLLAVLRDAGTPLNPEDEALDADAWGRKLYLKAGPASAVCSQGADGVQGNDDDLCVPLPY